MNNWKILKDVENKKVWDFVFSELHFKPHEEKELITLPLPNKYFDISRFYNDGFVEELYNNLHESAQAWFEKISNGERMFALNWQHDCYSFTADLPFEKDEYNEWLIPVFPNGDYLFFLTNDFKNGIFADGVNFQLLIWGGDIIKAFETKTPDMLKVNNSRR
ncbi:DUF2716 domain-containing protein [Lacibacter luteus]|nr:DUF2716 domain-containing protein [Lacibacter luteus]